MILTEEKHTRFKDADWYGERPTIIVGGAGGIGSWTTLLLARAGFNQILVYDNDSYDQTNIAGQFVTRNHIGKRKTRSLQELVSTFTGGYIVTKTESYNENSLDGNILIAGFDNMKARRDMFTVFKRRLESDKNALLIDGRLFAEGLHIYCVTSENADWYESEKLLSDEEIPDEMCTLKQTSHVAAMIASFIVSIVTNHVCNVKNDIELRTVPPVFKINIPNMFIRYD